MIFITYQVIVVVIVSIKSEASQFAYLLFYEFKLPDAGIRS